MGFEQIAYLSHYTTARNLQSIFGHGKILTDYDRWKMDIQSSVSTTNTQKKKFKVTDQFPGVFMSWHLGGESMENQFGSVILVFPRDLVRLQRNFHLNLCDKNGFFIEKGTFFHDDMPPDLAEGRSEMNEIVFHDSVKIKLCKYIYCRNSDTLEMVSRFAPKWVEVRLAPERFPRRAVVLARELRKHLNTESLPCRVFRTDIGYTGIPCEAKHPRRVSSAKFVRDIAVKAGYSLERISGLSAKDIEALMTKDGVYTRSFLERR